MKIMILVLVLWSSNDPIEIAKINRLKAEAKEAYTSGDYAVAAQKYSYLYDSLGVEEDQIALNLGHTYYAMKDSSNARTHYEQLTTTSDNTLKSIAYQQLGVMAKSPQTLKQSLAYLKSALKADPTNEGARYDYEVVKKLLDEQQKQQDQNKDQNKDDQQNKDQQNQDQEKQDEQQQDQENQDQQQQDQQQQDQENEEQKDSEQKDGEESDQEKEQQQQKEGEQTEEEQKKNQQMNTQKKLEEMNISEEKAEMILEAMRNNEIQYIQQQKRKATKSPDNGKPDW